MSRAAARPVLCVGELLIDLIASDGATALEAAGSFVARPGGAPANVAVALARLGVPSAFCGVVGNDPFGARLRATLAAEAVDASRLRSTDEADTTLAFAWKDAHGDGRFRLLRLADRLLDVDDVERAGIDRCAAIVVGSVVLSATPSRHAIEQAVAIAAAHDVPICVDLNLRPSLWADAASARDACLPLARQATFLKLSLDDARFLLETGDDPVAALASASALGATFTLLTDGSRGAWFDTAGAGRSEHVPAFEVEAVEPTGAGDAFTAALISRLMHVNWSAVSRDDVAYASAAGALTCTRAGAMEALPRASEVEEFLESRR